MKHPEQNTSNSDYFRLSFFLLQSGIAALRRVGNIDRQMDEVGATTINIEINFATPAGASVQSEG